MRAKKAKQLRRIVNEEFEYLPQVAYRFQQHKDQLVHTGNLNPNGTPSMQVVKRHTTHLGECKRAVYKSLKQAA